MSRGYLITLGKRIRTARLLSELTMFQLSMMVGFPQWTVLQRYEAGRAEIRASDLWKIAMFTGRPMEWFYD